MKLLVLPQTLHGGEVHTVEINYLNSYVATAGSDSMVNIWRLPQLLRVNQLTKAELAEVAPINRITVHESQVTDVQWNPTEELVFASGDNTGHVYISDLRDNSHKLVYYRPNSNPEKPLDIVDITWSADGRLLFWSTGDGGVHLYDSKKDTYQEFVTDKTTKGNGRAPLRRSVAFDPTNNFLATMGDDTFIHIYQYRYDEDGNYQFKITNRISKLMNNNPSSAVSLTYKKPSWSCDGEYFSVPTASKQQNSLISLLSRTDNWENKASLVGHDVDCNVVRFAPQIFQTITDPHDPNGFSIYNIIASAGSDKTLAIWNTSRESPIIVLRDLTDKPIVDISWEKTGNSLILATLDGMLIVINFEFRELGDPISEALLEKLQESQRNSIPPLDLKEADGAPQKKGTKATTDIIDQKDAMKLEDSFIEPSTETTEKKKDDETNNKDEPKPPAETHEVAGDVTPAVLDSNPPGQVDDIMSSAMIERGRDTQAARAKPSNKPSVPQQKANNAPPKISQKDGKKRIQPTLISTAKNEEGPSVSKDNTLSTISNSQGSAAKTYMEFEKPSYSVSEEFFKESKRNKAQEEGGPAKKAKRDLEPVKFIGSVVVNPNTTFAKVRLSVPKARMSFQTISRKDENLILDVKNGQGNESAPTRITLYKKEIRVWSDFIPKFVHLVAEGDSFWAACTVDGQIITYSHESGRRYLPPFILGSPVSFLESHSDYLMAVTSIAEIFVWDLKKKKLHMSTTQTLASLLDLNSKFEEDTLSKADNITMCAITSKGIPLVTLANGSGYLFNDDLGVWQTVTEAWWAFGSHYWDSMSDDKGSSEAHMPGILGNNQQSSILGLLEHKTNEEILRKSRQGRGKYFNKISKNMIMKEGFENLENTISLSHLENRILCCEILGEKEDFHDFLMVYAKRLCELGLKAKLFEVCEKLLVPVETEKLMNGDAKNGPQTHICGHEKNSLLKEIIFDCANNRDSQRILGHFATKLGLIEADYQ